MRGNIVLETGGDPVDALANYAKAVEVIERADVSEEVKEATRRNHLYAEALVALKSGDLAAAKEKARAYRMKAEGSAVAFELQQAHELAGMIAAQEGNAEVAIAELQQANQQDPRVLWMLSRAYERKGDSDRARAIASKSLLNQLNSLRFVRRRKRARSKLTFATVEPAPARALYRAVKGGGLRVAALFHVMFAAVQDCSSLSESRQVGTSSGAASTDRNRA